MKLGRFGMKVVDISNKSASFSGFSRFQWKNFTRTVVFTRRLKISKAIIYLVRVRNLLENFRIRSIIFEMPSKVLILEIFQTWHSHWPVFSLFQRRLESDLKPIYHRQFDLSLDRDILRSSRFHKRKLILYDS